MHCVNAYPASYDGIAVAMPEAVARGEVTEIFKGEGLLGREARGSQTLGLAPLVSCIVLVCGE